MTGGGGEADNAESLIRGFQRLVEYLGARTGGVLFVGGCTTPEKMSEEVEARAVEFAATFGKKTVSAASPRG